MAYFADNPNCPSNFLSGAGFQFSLKKLPGVSFYCQSANVPSQNLAVAMQATRFNTIPEPGDEVNYDDLTVRFLVDEDLKNYRSIHNWIRYLGHPESDQDWTTYADGDSYQEKQYSDGILFVLDSNFNRKFKIYFKDLFPVSLSGLNFDSTYTDTEYFAVDATFKFTIFDIEEVGATGFFTQADPPTVSISHTVDSNNNVILTWSSQNASYIIIDQGVGEASLFGTDTIPAANVSSRMSNGTLIYTITATGRGGTATAFTTVNIGTPVTNATIVNIAVIDESSEQNLVGMESKWTSFRTTYPDRKFYLLQPNNCTDYDALMCPPSFMEETDPTTITNVCGTSNSNIIGDTNFGHYTSTTQGRVETQLYNNSTQETDFSNINKYGVFIAGLETGCGSLSDMITLFTPGNAARTSVLNYINAGGVFWFKSEWVGGGCANHANVNTILTLLGTNIRINGESSTSGQLEATAIAISTGFPETIFHNATGLFDHGTPLYQIAGTTSAAWTYEKIGNGVIVCSADVNTYGGGFGPANNLITPTKFPPDEMYTGLRRLPFI